MARSYPAEWPVTDGLVDELPTIYFHMVSSAFPPANPASGCPAGWAEVSDWDIEWELDAPLLPGQIKADTKFIAATGSCTVELPEGAIIAPWRGGSEQTPSGGRAELWASHNGPTGSTAMLLGQFVLDPMKGNPANPYLAVSFVQDTIRLRKEHTIPSRNPGSWGGVGAWGNHAVLLEHAARSNGFNWHQVGSVFIGVDFAYFPRKTDQLDAMQQAVRANLGAMFLSMDGSTIEFRGFDYLTGAGGIVEVIDVADQLDKLEWSQDPNARVDRVAVTWTPPLIDGAPLGPAPFDTASVYTMAKGQGIPAGATWTMEFDPGSFIEPVAFGGTFQIMVNQYSSGAGDESTLTGYITEQSSGHWGVAIPNPTGAGKHFVLPYDRPARIVDGTVEVGQDRGWGASRGTPSFIPGRIDRASDNDTRTVAWGAGPDAATNALEFNVGRLITADANAVTLLNLVVGRVQSTTYVVEDFRLPLDFRRELADIYRLREPELGFDQRAIVTKLKLTGKSNEIVQTASLAILPLQPGD